MSDEVLCPHCGVFPPEFMLDTPGDPGLSEVAVCRCCAGAVLRRPRWRGVISAMPRVPKRRSVSGRADV